MSGILSYLYSLFDLTMVSGARISTNIKAKQIYSIPLQSRIFKAAFRTRLIFHFHLLHTHLLFPGQRRAIHNLGSTNGLKTSFCLDHYYKSKESESFSFRRDIVRCGQKMEAGKKTPEGEAGSRFGGILIRWYSDYT